MIQSSQSHATSSRSSAVLRRGALLTAVALAVGSLGCAFGELRPHDPLQREYSLEEMQKRYTDLVRFSNFSMAARYIAPDQRKEFMDSMPREDEVRFLDYETDPFVLNEEMTLSTVQVVYTAYSPWVLTQFELYETQTWSREEGMGNNWKVQSNFIGLEPYVKKRRRPFPAASPPAARAESADSGTH